MIQRKIKTGEQLLPIRFKQFIYFHFAKFGFFPRVNIYLQIIKKTNLPQGLKSTLREMAFAGLSHQIDDFINSYLSNGIILVKKRQEMGDIEPIVICAVRNDLDRIKMQVEHHRKIGIKHFIYIDNMSTDGTFEWLENQKDITLYRIESKFNASIKSAWWQLAIQREGYGKWYLILDSDELFAYPGMENMNIQKYIEFLKMKKISVITTPMIDMYSQNKLFEADICEDIKSRYCFFDTFYNQEYGYINWRIFGGPRFRVFNIDLQLTKHSLLRAEENIIVLPHKIFPFSRNVEKGAKAFLLHYKFLPGDMQKFMEIIKEKTYHNGSGEYKIYMKYYKQNHNTFYYSGSQKLNNSMDLLKINIVDKNFFEEYFSFLK